MQRGQCSTTEEWTVYNVATREGGDTQDYWSWGAARTCWHFSSWKIRSHSALKLLVPQNNNVSPEVSNSQLFRVPSPTSTPKSLNLLKEYRCFNTTSWVQHRILHLLWEREPDPLVNSFEAMYLFCCVVVSRGVYAVCHVMLVYTRRLLTQTP